MKNSNILMPLFRKIDKIIFGIDEINEIENQPTDQQSENEEEFDVERSTN